MFQAGDTVQVRVDRDQPVHGGGQESREVLRRDVFARMESRVLTHVGQTGRDEADPYRAQFVRHAGCQVEPVLAT